MELNETILYTYKYVWEALRDAEDNAHTLCYRLVTDTDEGHRFFREALLKDEGIKSALCEYVCQYNGDEIGKVIPIKSPEKS